MLVVIKLTMDFERLRKLSSVSTLLFTLQKLPSHFLCHDPKVDEAVRRWHLSKDPLANVLLPDGVTFPMALCYWEIIHRFEFLSATSEPFIIFLFFSYYLKILYIFFHLFSPLIPCRASLLSINQTSYSFSLLKIKQKVLKILEFSYPRSFHLQIVSWLRGGLYVHFPCFMLRLLSGLSLLKTYRWSHSLYEFICSSALLYLKNTVFLKSFTSSSSSSLSALFPTEIPRPWAGRCDESIPLRAEYCSFSYSVHWPAVSLNHHLLRVEASFLRVEWFTVYRNMSLKAIFLLCSFSRIMVAFLLGPGFI